MVAEGVAAPDGTFHASRALPDGLVVGQRVAFQAVAGPLDPGVSPVAALEVGTAPVRFVALGDAGEGNDDQHAVGEAIAAACEERGCDFALYLGDNFYDEGVFAVDDPQFETKFESPYAPVDLVFHAVPGEHDHGLDELGGSRVQYQIDHTPLSAKWSMTGHFGWFERGDAQFVGLDTTDIVYGSSAGALLGVDTDEDAFVADALASSDAGWRVAYGHHTYRSNGRHGDAGAYEGISFIPIVSGSDFEDFVDDQLCGSVDLYISAHDHNLQWLEPVCGMHVLVSGAGAKTTDLEHDHNPVIAQVDHVEGFFWVELGDRLRVAMIDKDGGVHVDAFRER